VGPRAGLDGYRNLVPTGIRSPNRPSRTDSLYRLSYPGPQTARRNIKGVTKIFRTDGVKFINLTTKRVWKMPKSTQLRATWHTDSLDMVVLSPAGASRNHDCCIDGSTSPEYFGYFLVQTTSVRFPNACHSECLNTSNTPQNSRDDYGVYFMLFTSCIFLHPIFFKTKNTLIKIK
jgi:hypothetical protein